MAHAAQPVSLAHTHNSTRLRDSVHQATSQVQRRSRDVGGSPERPCLARGDCCPPGKGCNRAGPSSRDEAGVLQPLHHRTQERWWPSANPGSASLEPGFAQAPVQDADAQACDQMHSAPGLVCSDRPEGRLLSRFDPSATQTVSTVCVRRSGMAVQGPPLRLSLSPRVFTKVVEGALIPLREVGVRILNYLDDWLILAQSREQLGDHRDLVLRHQSGQVKFQLGLRVNWEKSKLSPVQRISFLGVELDSVRMMARLMEERAQAVLNCLSSFRGRNVVPLKQFQRLLGHMASAAAVTPLGYVTTSALATLPGPEVGMAPRYTASRYLPAVLPLPQPLGRPCLSTGWGAPRTSVPAYCCHNRCLQHGLGRYMQWAGSLGALDRAPTALAHQLPGAVGSAFSLATVPATAVGQARASPHGQHCGGLVYQPAGGGVAEQSDARPSTGVSSPRSPVSPCTGLG